MGIKKAVLKKARRKSPAPKPEPAPPVATQGLPEEPEQLGLGIVTDPAIVDILDDRLLLPSALSALAFGISETALKKWKIKHRTQRGRQTLYYLPDLIKYRVSRADSSDNNLSISRTRLAMAQADKTELEVKTMRGELIPADLVLHKWSEIVAAARIKILGTKSKVKTQIPRLTDDELKIIDDTIRAALEGLADSGLQKTTK